MSDKNNKTSDEEHERAFARMDANYEKNHQGLSEVVEKIRSRFVEIHEFWLNPEHHWREPDPDDVRFFASVFFHLDQQLEEASESGLEVRIRNAIIDEMENVGRGDRNSLEISFNFDSYENVVREYGSYWNLLR